MEHINFLQRFLESYSTNGGEEDDDSLESRVASAAHAAEDVIESHIVDQIHGGSNMSTVYFGQRLERVIQDMDLIKKEVMEIMTGKIIGCSSSTWQSSTMVDLNDVLVTEVADRLPGEQSDLQIIPIDGMDAVLDKLTGQPSNLLIIPVIGMGGIDKTTLARNIYSSPLIVQRFDILVWVTVSQNYSGRDILLQLLVNEIIESESEDELGERVHKKLYGRRYLIVMDDIWSIEAWHKVKFFLPDNNNSSRIMMTTRMSNLAYELSDSYVFQMKFLDEDRSWDLFCKIVFGNVDCLTELEEIGKKIMRCCRGLPLSIVVIGGLLAKSNMTHEYWEHTLKNLSSVVNLENNEHCLQVLGTSFKELPIHLKACFLYMGNFREDCIISVSELIKLWVAEGILRPIDDRSLEEAAQVYLKELVDRNLILVHKLRWNGEVKLCKIHDLLRDLCLREAKKQKLSCVLSRTDHEPSSSLSFRLSRVYSNHFVTSSTPAKTQANLRYYCGGQLSSRFPASCSICWNLQTLKIQLPYNLNTTIFAIWGLPLLRHVMFNALRLTDPPHCAEANFVLNYMQTLSRVRNFKFSKEAIKRMPNIRTLKLLYYITDEVGEEEELPNFYLSNLGELGQLQCLNLMCNEYDVISHPETFSNFTFPDSLKKLTLHGTLFLWEDVTSVIGSLPHLEFLKLSAHSCTGLEWETSEGGFCNLKFLLIEMCSFIKNWKTEDTHFPCLEHLVLRDLRVLEEIPSSIGDIMTLQSVLLERCSEAASDSVLRIKEEQEELGNVDLKVHIVKVEGNTERHEA